MAGGLIPGDASAAAGAFPGAGDDVALSPGFAPRLPFERASAGYGSPYSPLGTLPAIPELDAPAPAPRTMGIDTSDTITFTQSGSLYVQRSADLRASDRVIYQGRKYVLMGAKNWDLPHPLNGHDLVWMTFGIQVDPKQLIADVLAALGQSIALIPVEGTVVEKPGGGKDYTPGTPRAPQVFAKFNTHALDGADKAPSDRGTTRKFQFELIGANGAVVRVGDHWEDHVASYVVDVVDDTQPYQIKATVTAFLKTSGHGHG